MIEKIRISLWDLLTFFMSGLFFVIIICIHLYFEIDQDTIQKIQTNIKSYNIISTPFILFVLPIIFTLVGMLLEPLANLWNRKIANPIWNLKFFKKTNNKKESEALESMIKEMLLQEYRIEVPDTYHFCKDYIEQKQTNANFMVFLARFGFYRNVAFICSLSVIATPFVVGFGYKMGIIIVVWIFLIITFKKRSEDFYSYLAPTVYRSFIACQLSDPVDLNGSDIFRNR